MILIHVNVNFMIIKCMYASIYMYVCMKLYVANVAIIKYAST